MYIGPKLFISGLPIIISDIPELLITKNSCFIFNPSFPILASIITFPFTFASASPTVPNCMSVGSIFNPNSFTIFSLIALLDAPVSHNPMNSFPLISIRIW